jgi:hypothetical protein
MTGASDQPDMIAIALRTPAITVAFTKKAPVMPGL